MLCGACNIALDSGDNYCRRCGAPVRMVDMTPVVEAAPVTTVTVVPPAGAIVTRLARPVIAGVAIVATGALVRLAARVALQVAAGNAGRVMLRSAGRMGALGGDRDGPDVTEVYSYHRIIRR